MGRGPFYTKAELCRAEELKALGLTWPEVAERLRRPAKGLAETMRTERLGTRATGKLAAARERNARVIAAAEAGESVSVIALREGISPAHVRIVLLRDGLDAEMRAEIRAA